MEVVAAIAWSAGAGLSARLLLPEPRPNVGVSSMCGLTGWLIGLAADRLLGLHALHPFRADGLLPATGIALVTLFMLRRQLVRRRGKDRRTLFFRS